MSTLKVNNITDNSGGTNNLNMKSNDSNIIEYIEYRKGELFWKKKPSMPVKVGDKVGSATKDGYLRFKFRGRTYANHRVIFFLHYGWFPEEVDHINLNKLDNRIKNLRAATKSENQANCNPYKGRKLKGSYKLNSGRFMSVIQKDNNRYYLGVFDTEEEAANAYDVASRKYHKNFARSNKT